MPRELPPIEPDPVGAGERREPGDERDLGEQPLTRLMRERGLASHDLVAASSEQLTHKAVQRACRGRRLTAHMMEKVRRALNAAAAADYALSDLFDYGPAQD